MKRIIILISISLAIFGSAFCSADLQSKQAKEKDELTISKASGKYSFVFTESKEQEVFYQYKLENENTDFLTKKQWVNWTIGKVGLKVYFDKDTELYSHCPNSVNEISSPHLIQRDCFISPLNEDLYVKLVYEIYLREYERHYSAGSHFLDSLYAINFKFQPESEINKVRYWASKVHELVQYRVGPMESMDSILNSGYGDCEAYVMMTQYLLEKSNVAARPMITNSSYSFLGNVSASTKHEFGRDHLALYLPDEDALIEVTDIDPSSFGFMLNFYSTSPAYDVYAQKAKAFENEFDINIKIDKELENIEFSYFESGSNLSKLHKVIPRLDEIDLLPMYDYFLSGSTFAPSREYLQLGSENYNKREFNVSYRYDEKLDKNKEWLSLPFSVGPLNSFLYSSDEYYWSACYFGPNLSINIDESSLLANSDVSWSTKDDYFNAEIEIVYGKSFKFALERLRNDARCSDIEFHNNNKKLIDLADKLAEYGLILE
ncbi:hypothetical protein [Reinekea sp.]|uniref:hypothetical protein n=1 Tax=Reinekea sp. TaxID=1970455 RepID=UPI00257E655F|nr:hypothetical protein [Reinekea sp.]